MVVIPALYFCYNPRRMSTKETSVRSQRTPSKRVVVALRMAGIAGQDKLNGIFEHLSTGHRWQLAIYRTNQEFTADTVREELEKRMMEGRISYKNER